MKLDARACYETEQSEQPQQYRLNYVVLTEKTRQSHMASNTMTTTLHLALMKLHNEDRVKYP